MAIPAPSAIDIALQNLCAIYLRPCTLNGDPVNGIVATFEPPLTANEQLTFADLKLMAGFGITSNITLAEFQAIKPDLATAKAFVGIASPTAAQSNAALKSTIRVLGALLRS